jgi:hypothetical protein
MAHNFEGFKKRFKLWWYELGNGKKCELQHHFNYYYLIIEYGFKK